MIPLSLVEKIAEKLNWDTFLNHLGDISKSLSKIADNGITLNWNSIIDKQKFTTPQIMPLKRMDEGAAVAKPNPATNPMTDDLRWNAENGYM